MRNESLFHIVSIGYAAENKPLSTNDLEVYPTEILPFVDGEVTTGQTDIKHKGRDKDGKNYDIQIKVANSIKCKWLQWGSNRLTAPDVRRRERVIIWQFADVDQYYWTTTGMDDWMRRLETAVYLWSGTQDESTKTLTPENSYFMEVSTHRGLVTFSNSKANKEPFRYTAQFNTKTGTFTLQDDNDNFFHLNSQERFWHMQNKDGTFVKLDKRNMFGNAPDTIKFTCKDWVVDATNSMTQTTKDYTLTASATITEKTTTYKSEASASYTFKSPQAMFQIGASTYTGTVLTQGLLTMAAGFAATAGGGAAGTVNVPLTVTSPSTFNGNVATVGTLTNNGKDVGSTHTHTETGTGGGVTTPPI